jgi:hypothetical protein
MRRKVSRQTLPRTLSRRLCGKQKSAYFQGTLGGRYWARTSDPQLVDSEQRPHRFAHDRFGRIVERNPCRPPIRIEHQRTPSVAIVATQHSVARRPQRARPPVRGRPSSRHRPHRTVQIRRSRNRYGPKAPRDSNANPCHPCHAEPPVSPDIRALGQSRARVMKEERYATAVSAPVSAGVSA